VNKLLNKSLKKKNILLLQSIANKLKQISQKCRNNPNKNASFYLKSL